MTPYPNLNPYPYPWNPEGYRSVTINKIAMVEFRIDSGEWVAVNIDSGSSGTNPVENFTFIAPDLSPGNHTVEVRAANQWGNSGYFNETVTIAEFSSSDLNKDGKVNIQDITIVAIAYKANPEDPRWNLIADIDKNGVIDILDITKVAIDYGKTA